MSNGGPTRKLSTTQGTGIADAALDLLGSACDAVVVLDANGIIRELRCSDSAERAAPAAQKIGSSFADTLAPDSAEKFRFALSQLEEGRLPERPLEMNHRGARERTGPIRYRMAQLENGGIALFGHDLTDTAELQAQLMQAQLTLEEGYEQQREYDARYRLLLREIHDRVLFVSTDGRIRDANEPAAALLETTRDNLVGRNCRDFLMPIHDGALMDQLADASGLESNAQVVVVPKNGEMRLAIEPTSFRAAGERMMLLRVAPETEMGKPREALDLDLSLLYELAPDAVLFCTLSGAILSCNDSFLDLVGTGSASEFKGRSVADFLARGQVDFNVLVENARRNRRIRLYATKLVNALGAEFPVEISAVYLNDRATPELGLIIRSTHRSEGARGAQFQTSEESSQNVMGLVGSATLKEIVAETTDVVEKMCIETAINLTRNNRVAAAEMLGLSRQSLYVKLRKYDLLSRDPSDES